MRFFGEYSDGFRLTSIKIIYHLPDYYSILNEFWWQAMDKPPHYPRMKTFVDYWNDYIQAVIHSLEIGHHEPYGPARWTNVTDIFKLK